MKKGCGMVTKVKFKLLTTKLTDCGTSGFLCKRCKEELESSQSEKGESA